MRASRLFFFFQAEDGIRDKLVTGVQTCALPIYRHALHLIRMWLETPAEETDERGRKKRTTRNRDMRQGTAQGSPLSPLLANIYMRRFVLGWKRLGYEQRLRARIVSYADDLVICCKGSADEALTAMRDTMSRLKLTVNERK